ncbi:hypothetical protein [Phenylobacterium sp.]|uniref:hypothetical protein n=1 Tax=Phenylobacterium sp. TaxID=1871053 RepID=UPI0025E81D70|nr:hypothetical protein [Phenylobacterium sp.]
MADPKDDPPAGETPMQRALRLKKAAQAKGGPPGRRLEDERSAAARSASKSKPWMKKS